MSKSVHNEIRGGGADLWADRADSAQVVVSTCRMQLKHAALSTAAQRMPPSLSMPMENIDSQGEQLQEMDSEKSFKVG